MLLLAVAIALAYGGALRAPFLFDDWAAIVENETIRDARDLRRILSPPPNTGVTGRPFVNLTLALNHALGGLDPRGYHAFNIAAHIATALLLLAVLRRTLRDAGTAFAASLVWAIHPLLTESITCVIQRNEILAGFFLLLTLYAFIRGSDPQEKHPWRWHALAVASCWLGMAAKEVMVVAPLMVLLYDRAFVAGTFRVAWQRHRRIHLALAGGWLLLGWLMTGSEQRGGTVGFGLGVSAADYLLTQCRAIVMYLKLSLWPYPLVLDYGTGVESRLAAVWPQAALLVLLTGGTVAALRRAPALGFLGVMFFALLAPSSSFVPLTTQTMSEHRFYLPLALVVVATAAGVRRVSASVYPAIWVAPVAALALLTHARNHDYRSELAIWTDTVAKVPANARAHNNLGLVLFHRGQIEEAHSHYKEALRLAPAYSPAHANLADVLATEGRSAEAIAAYEIALQITPELGAAARKLAQLRHTAGVAALKAGAVAEAVAHLTAAVQWTPADATARNNLGTALLAQGRIAEARTQFQEALRLQPGYVRARDNLARLDALEKMPDGKN